MALSRESRALGGRANPTPEVLDDTPEVSPVLAVDPTTGEVLADGSGGCARCEANERKAEAAIYDLHNAERELRALRRKVKALEAELREQRQEAPEAQMVKAIFNAWVKATGRNPKRTKLGPAREKAVLARLREGRDFDYILRAVTIGAQAAHVSDRDSERIALLAALREATELLSESDAQKVRATYKRALGSTTKYDDLELICRNEVNLERFAALADRIDPDGTKHPLDAAEGV